MELRRRREGGEEDEGRNVRARIDDSDDANQEHRDENQEENYGVHEDDDNPEASCPVVRDHELTFENNSKKYTMKLALRTHYEYQSVRYVDVSLFFNEEQIGYLDGYILPRPSPIFFEMGDGISEELHELTCMFCDPNGRADRIETGLTGSEVNEGGFLELYRIELRKAHQGQDLGLRLVHETLLFTKGDWNLAVMVPSTLSTLKWNEEDDFVDPASNPDSSQEQNEGNEADLKIKRYFARLGFNQSGRTKEHYGVWYITSKQYFPSDDATSESIMNRWKTKEESHQLDIYLPPKPHVPEGVSKELHELICRGFNQYVRSVNVFDVILGIEDLVGRGASIHNARALHVAAEHASEGTAIIETLMRFGGDVNLPDENGNCPLHLAALKTRPLIIRYLIGQGADLTATNHNGETPLDCLRKGLRDHEDYKKSMGIAQLRPVDVSQKVEAINLFMSAEQRALLVDGWLSPRLLKMYEITAGIVFDSVTEANNNLQEDALISLGLCCGNDGIPRIEYIPPSVLENNPRGFYKAFIDGWAIAFKAILSLLQSNQAPTVRRVQAYIERSDTNCDQEKWHHFESKGGKIEYALNALLEITKNVALDKPDGWEYENYRDDIEALPSTPLDDAFDVARVKLLGLRNDVPRTQRNGPYEHSFVES